MAQKPLSQLALIDFFVGIPSRAAKDCRDMETEPSTEGMLGEEAAILCLGAALNYARC